MAITQKDIKQSLCELVTYRDCETIRMLRHLVFCGWGECELYKQLGELRTKIQEKVKEVGNTCLSHQIVAKLDKNTLVLTDIKCKKCHDTGRYLDSVKVEFFTCPDCSANTKVEQ